LNKSVTADTIATTSMAGTFIKVARTSIGAWSDHANHGAAAGISKNHPLARNPASGKCNAVASPSAAAIDPRKLAGTATAPNLRESNTSAAASVSASTNCASAGGAARARNPANPMECPVSTRTEPSITSTPDAALNPPIIGSGMNRITREARTVPKAINNAPVSNVASAMTVSSVGMRCAGATTTSAEATSTSTAVGLLSGPAIAIGNLLKSAMARPPTATATNAEKTPIPNPARNSPEKMSAANESA
jgi:hypothetical protein